VGVLLQAERRGEGAGWADGLLELKPKHGHKTGAFKWSCSASAKSGSTLPMSRTPSFWLVLFLGVILASGVGQAKTLMRTSCEPMLREGGERPSP
jgi:hypothetical protein